MTRALFFAVVAGGLFSYMWQLSPHKYGFWIVAVGCIVSVAITKW